MDGRIGDEPALLYLLAARFELRLDECHHVAFRCEEGRKRGEDVLERDERHVDGDQVDLVWHIILCKRSRIDTFSDDHARIRAETPVELIVADVERDDIARLLLQEDIGESPGRGADVERSAARHVDAEYVEGSAGELGKTAGKDALSEKPTYPSLFGLDRSRTLAAECADRARQILVEAKLTRGWLGAIAEWVVTRRS